MSRAAAEKAHAALELRLTTPRLGKSAYRETDYDIIAMRDAERALRVLLDERFTRIAHEVIAEAHRSIDKHGEQTQLPMGTGPDTGPLEARPVEAGSLHRPGMWPGMRARQLARIATQDTKAHSANEGGDDTCSWWLILREEVFEAASESDPTALRAELVQVAAVALKMIDALDLENRSQ